MEFALKTNIPAIPTCISDFFSVCVYGVFRKDVSRYLGDGFSNIMNDTNMTPLPETPRLTSRSDSEPCVCRHLPMSLQTEYRSGYLGSKISNFYYHVLKTQSLLKPTLNTIPILPSEKKFLKQVTERSVVGTKKKK